MPKKEKRYPKALHTAIDEERYEYIVNVAEKNDNSISQLTRRMLKRAIELIEAGRFW